MFLTITYTVIENGLPEDGKKLITPSFKVIEIGDKVVILLLEIKSLSMCLLLINSLYQF